MITLKRFRRVEAVLREAGYGAIIDWSETIAKPADAEAFAEAAIYVVCNSGFKNSIAKPICERCMVALRAGLSSATEFRHPGKQRAIDRIWAEREDMFAAYQLEPDKLRYLVTLPWVGPVTRFHLEKNLGGDHAKPDVRLVQQSNYRALHYRSDASASRTRQCQTRFHRRATPSNANGLQARGRLHGHSESGSRHQPWSRSGYRRRGALATACCPPNRLRPNGQSLSQIA